MNFERFSNSSCPNDISIKSNYYIHRGSMPANGCIGKSQSQMLCVGSLMCCMVSNIIVIFGRKRAKLPTAVETREYDLPIQQ